VKEALPMKLATTVIVLETLIIGILLGLLLAVNQPVPRDQPDLLTHFDQTDFERIKEMLTRFEEGKGDNLTILRWGIDSGPFVYDFYTDGQVLHLRADLTRDYMSTAPGKTEYVCKSVTLEETAEFYNVELYECKDYPKEQHVQMITFRKDEL
jgi:hypothetical protein